MADKKQFAFLKEAWGIELTEQAIKTIIDTSESLDPRSIQAYLKDTDIRKFGVISSLPKELTRLTDALPHGKYLVQVQKIADITQPSKFQEDFEGGKWRLLAVDFADGEQKFRGMEYRQVKDLGVHLPPGTKALLWSTPQAPLHVHNGHVLLTQDTCEVLGGEVEKLVESWRASKDVAEQRLLWRTEGVKKKEKGEGAPLWEDFDPRKAPPRGSAGAKKAQEDEMAMWRCEAAKGGGQAKKEVAAERDQKESRFQVSDFQADGEEPKQVKSQVNSNAFAQAPSKGGKGKSSKGEGEGKSKGKGRRDRDGDDYQEEKRAPTVAANTLAAFIKPTKKGDVSEEAVAALLAPDPPAAARGAGNGGWDAGWDAGGWDDAAWQGGGGWGSGGWGGGYKGGGGGGKGGKKGGGKGGKGKSYGKKY